MFPSDFLEELRRLADIVRYVADHVPLKRSGSSWKGLCPFHADTQPSFRVRADPPLFHCFGCGAAGDVFKFAMLHGKASFPEAVELVARHFGVALPSASAAAITDDESLAALEPAARYFSRTLWTDNGRRARDYIVGRGFERGTLERVRAGAAPAGWDGLVRALRGRFAPAALCRAGLVKEVRGRLFDRFRARVMIPILDRGGRVVAFAGRTIDGSLPKYLNSETSVHYQKGRLLYGASWARDAIVRQGSAIVMEGYFDVIHSLQAGIENAVATCGSALGVVQARWLARLAPDVLLSFDQDAGGLGAARRAVELLAAEGQPVRVVQLPEGHDPDSFIRTEGATAYRERLAKAAEGMDWLLGTLARRIRTGDGRGAGAYVAALVPIVARLKNPEQLALWLSRAVEALTQDRAL